MREGCRCGAVLQTRDSHGPNRRRFHLQVVSSYLGSRRGKGVAQLFRFLAQEYLAQVDLLARLHALSHPGHRPGKYLPSQIRQCKYLTPAFGAFQSQTVNSILQPQTAPSGVKPPPDPTVGASARKDSAAVAFPVDNISFNSLDATGSLANFENQVCNKGTKSRAWFGRGMGHFSAVTWTLQSLERLLTAPASSIPTRSLWTRGDSRR